MILPFKPTRDHHAEAQLRHQHVVRIEQPVVWHAFSACIAPLPQDDWIFLCFPPALAHRLWWALAIRGEGCGGLLLSSCGVFVDTERWIVGNRWEKQGGALSLRLPELLCHYWSAATGLICFCCYQWCEACTAPPHASITLNLHLYERVSCYAPAITGFKCESWGITGCWLGSTPEWALWFRSSLLCSYKLLVQCWELSSPSPEAVVPAGLSDTWQYLLLLTYWSRSCARVQLESACFVFVGSVEKLAQTAAVHGNVLFFRSAPLNQLHLSLWH